MKEGKIHQKPSEIYSGKKNLKEHTAFWKCILNYTSIAGQRVHKVPSPCESLGKWQRFHLLHFISRPAWRRPLTHSFSQPLTSSKVHVLAYTYRCLYIDISYQYKRNNQIFSSPWPKLNSFFSTSIFSLQNVLKNPVSFGKNTHFRNDRYSKSVNIH